MDATLVGSVMETYFEIQEITTGTLRAMRDLLLVEGGHGLLCALLRAHVHHWGGASGSTTGSGGGT